MPTVSMDKFLALRMNGKDMTNFVGQTIRLMGKVICQQFEDDEIEMTLKMPDGTFVNVIKCGVCPFN
jgi:hypothetical protein